MALWLATIVRCRLRSPKAAERRLDEEADRIRETPAGWKFKFPRLHSGARRRATAGRTCRRSRGSEMKVFLSWSGERSNRVAKALHDLLPEILQDVEPWMSEHEIAAGHRWGDQLNSVLEGAAIGIVCLTKENLNAPWLLDEAGSLAKSVSGSRVVPYLLGLTAADISFPLAQFQGVDTSETGTRKLLDSLNAARPSPMLDDRLNRMFARWWPDLSSRLSQIPELAPTAQPVRSDRALLEEVLQLARQFATHDATAASRHLSVRRVGQIRSFCAEGGSRCHGFRRA